MAVIDAEENDDNKTLVYVKGCEKVNGWMVYWIAIEILLITKYRFFT